MKITNTTIQKYLMYCEHQKQLDQKTIKAYRIDLMQFQKNSDGKVITTDLFNQYICNLHHQYRANTVKRKIASLHAFFHYLYRNDMIEHNPMDKVQTRFRHQKTLPRTISLAYLEQFYALLYEQKKHCSSDYRKLCNSRDIAIFELLLGTGLRISELCHIKTSDIDFREQYIRILGKGNKERILQIGNDTLYQALSNYRTLRNNIVCAHDYFFINKFHERLSEQSVRDRIKQICKELAVHEPITPHMFRHTFATLLLEEDIDIRYIQHILGHSSIITTQIYTHIRSTKQADILNNRNPRNFIKTH